MRLIDLKKPFAPDEVEWRLQQSGKSSGGKVYALALCYVTNRAIMDRLDAVCGAENWRNEYTPAPMGGVMCGLSIKVGTEWITKWDGADNTDIEGTKGGLSGAMKRAAVQWGIGRYLYHLDATFAETSLEKIQGWNRAKLQDRTPFWWQTPVLPPWAQPKPPTSEEMLDEINNAKGLEELRAIYQVARSNGLLADANLAAKLNAKVESFQKSEQ